MTTTSLAAGIPLALIMVLAAASDLRSRRIPNALTVTGMIAAPVLVGVLEGPVAAVASVVGGALALMVGMVLFALGALGGGDAKLLAVAGAFMGPARLVSALLVIGITGGVLALATALASGRLLSTLVGAWNTSLRLATLGRRGAASTIESPNAFTIPYGVAIAIGSVVTWGMYASGTLTP